MFDFTGMVEYSTPSWFSCEHISEPWSRSSDAVGDAYSADKDVLRLGPLSSSSARATGMSYVMDQQLQPQKLLNNTTSLHHLLCDITNENSIKCRHSSCKTCCHIIVGCDANDDDADTPRENASTRAAPPCEASQAYFGAQYDAKHCSKICSSIRSSSSSANFKGAMPLQHTNLVTIDSGNYVKGAISMNTLVSRTVNSIYPPECKRGAPTTMLHMCGAPTWLACPSTMCGKIGCPRLEQQKSEEQLQRQQQRWRSSCIRHNKSKHVHKHRREQKRRAAGLCVETVHSPLSSVGGAADQQRVPSPHCAHARRKVDHAVDETCAFSSTTTVTHDVACCASAAYMYNGLPSKSCSFVEQSAIAGTPARSVAHRCAVDSLATNTTTSMTAEALMHEQPMIALCQQDCIPYDYDEEMDRINNLHSYHGHHIASRLGGAADRVGSHKPFSHAWLNEQKRIHEAHCSIRREMWVKKLSDANSMEGHLAFKMKTLVATAFWRDLAQLSALPPSAFDDRLFESSSMRFSATSWKLMLQMRRCTPEQRKRLFISTVRAQWRVLQREISKELYEEENLFSSAASDTMSTSASKLMQHVKQLTLFNTNPLFIIRELGGNAVDEMRAQRQRRAEQLLRSLHAQGRFFLLPRLYAEQVTPPVPVSLEKQESCRSQEACQNKLLESREDVEFDVLASRYSPTPDLSQDDVTARLGIVCSGIDSPEWAIHSAGDEVSESGDSATFADLDVLMLSASLAHANEGEESCIIPNLSFNPVKLECPLHPEVQCIARLNGNKDAEMAFV